MASAKATCASGERFGGVMAPWSWASDWIGMPNNSDSRPADLSTPIHTPREGPVGKGPTGYATPPTEGREGGRGGDTGVSTGGGAGGASNAAGFLSRFVDHQNCAWLHLDIAAAYNRNATELMPAGGTAIGIRSIAHTLLQA